MMKVYPSLFAYLNDSQPIPYTTIPHSITLRASQRPVIVLDSEAEADLSTEALLIPIGDQAYEIGFPYLKVANIKDENYQLEYIFNISISDESYRFCVRDEVLDLESIKEEEELREWKQNLGESLDNTVAPLIRLFVGMFANNIFGYSKMTQNILLTQLPNILDNIKIDEANIPIAISLERRYQLRRKLEIIGSKLRHQLRRQAELMSVGRIQEMDSYCLRDYVRRPGRTPAEKAGSKQELMGIKRYQDFNTPENKFLVYFSKILHLNCDRYEQSKISQYKKEISKFRLTIDLFTQEVSLKGIQDRGFNFTKPNYVLQQNPIYRSFYQAYLEYIQKRHEKENIWQFRNQLLADTVYLCLIAALLRFQGTVISPLASIFGNAIPDRGRYLSEKNHVKIPVFLQNQVYIFSLSKPQQKYFFDWVLTLEIHNLESKELKTEQFILPIWVFWYRPSDELLTDCHRYLREFNNNKKNNNFFLKGLLFYLQISPKTSASTQEIEHHCEGQLLLCKLPDPIAEQGFSQTTVFIINLIQSVVESAV